MLQRQVSFGEAIQLALVKNYCNFNGRASRSEYWWYALFQVILNAVISLLGHSTFMQIIAGLIGIALILPGLGLCARRLHDIGKSGWWQLIVLIPLVGWIIAIVWYCKPSDPTDNQYGPVPNLE